MVVITSTTTSTTKAFFSLEENKVKGAAALEMSLKRLKFLVVSGEIKLHGFEHRVNVSWISVVSEQQ